MKISRNATARVIKRQEEEMGFVINLADVVGHALYILVPVHPTIPQIHILL